MKNEASKGSETYTNRNLAWVNVQDVADTHIQAFQNPSASGRYCLVESVVYNYVLLGLITEMLGGPQ
uniref:Cinnamoyl-CoA reductase 1-like n=1 Tax=Tanacetum cinerariifolium TaxID=118510 RepID=A0A6L2LP83_TANCI|nr:cinnamoyl-CoA reductase 1-like [Tanacetum cinerariifolium]